MLRGRKIKLRCLSFRKFSPDKVVSLCLDLDIFAEADSLKRSKEKLIDAIILYVQHATENNEVDELIPRKAPAKYFILYFVAFCSLGLSKISNWLKKLIENRYNFDRFSYQAEY